MQSMYTGGPVSLRPFSEASLLSFLSDMVVKEQDEAQISSVETQAQSQKVHVIVL